MEREESGVCCARPHQGLPGAASPSPRAALRLSTATGVHGPPPTTSLLPLSPSRTAALTCHHHGSLRAWTLGLALSRREARCPSFTPHKKEPEMTLFGVCGLFCAEVKRKIFLSRLLLQQGIQMSLHPRKAGSRIPSGAHANPKVTNRNQDQTARNRDCGL